MDNEYRITTGLKLEKDIITNFSVTGQWFSPGTPVSSTNKTDHHEITEILLKVALNTITITPQRQNIPNKSLWEQEN